MSNEGQLRHAQKVMLDRELKDKTGLSVSQMRQKASFQQRIETMQATRLAKAASQIAPPRAPIVVSETKLEPRTITEGVRANGANENGDKAAINDPQILNDVVYLDTFDSNLYYTNLFTDGRKELV